MAIINIVRYKDITILASDKEKIRAYLIDEDEKGSKFIDSDGYAIEFNHNSGIGFFDNLIRAGTEGTSTIIVSKKVPNALVLFANSNPKLVRVVKHE